MEEKRNNRTTIKIEELTRKIDKINEIHRELIKLKEVLRLVDGNNLGIYCGDQYPGVVFLKDNSDFLVRLHTEIKRIAQEEMFELKEQLSFLLK